MQLLLSLLPRTALSPKIVLLLLVLACLLIITTLVLMTGHYQHALPTVTAIDGL